jgi:uncharacterized protein YdaU (DUF1376 family)
MSKDPRFNFYPDNYEGGTDFFTLEMDGAYLRLFILQFRYGQFTERQAIQKLMTRCPENPGRATELWNSLKDKYQTDGVNFWNQRLRDEIEKSKKSSEDQRDRANKRWGKQSGTNPVYTGAIPEPIPTQVDTFSSSSNSNSNSTSNTNNKKNAAEAAKRFDPLVFIPESWDKEEFLTRWNGHIDARKKRRKPPTDFANEINLKDLVKYFPVWSDAKERMEQAIQRGWMAFVFKEDKGEKKNQPAPGKFAHERQIQRDRA